MKHALAPWRIDAHKVSNNNGQKDYTIIRILDAEGRLVTEMTDLSRTEQNMANAELIAQAPRLASFADLITSTLRMNLSDEDKIDWIRDHAKNLLKEIL